MNDDLSSFRSLPPALRERACFVFEAALAEGGFGKSNYPGSVPLDTPPRDAHKAWSLALVAVGQQPCSYDDWIQRAIVSNLGRPEALWRWRLYIERHGIRAEPSCT